MNNIPVFVDSDVIIASLLSQNGAAYYLCTHQGNYTLTISDISQNEIERVARRLHISQEQTQERLNTLNIVALPQDKKYLEEMHIYVHDLLDSHIVLGAYTAQVSFLLTYNTKHYHIDKIKQNLSIITLTPARFLQYLRSKAPIA